MSRALRSMPEHSTTSPATLTKALLRAAQELGLSADLSSLLQSSPDDIASLQSGARVLDAQREEWMRALKIVSLFRTLVSLVGTTERARAWLGSPNQALGASPIELLRSSDAERVHRYLDAVSKHELRMPPRWRREH
jgi:Protein of unknown function (DUF2384)